MQHVFLIIITFVNVNAIDFDLQLQGAQMQGLSCPLAHRVQDQYNQSTMCFVSFQNELMGNVSHAFILITSNILTQILMVVYDRTHLPFMHAIAWQ